MIYKVRQVTDKFGNPFNNSATYDHVFPVTLKIGSIVWLNNLTDDNLSGEYKVLEKIDK